MTPVVYVIRISQPVDMATFQYLMQFVSCAVFDRPIGVDIQEIVSYRRDLAKRVFNPKEFLQIASSPDPSAEFTKLWTQKEAYLKMFGIGVYDGLGKIALPRQAKSQTARYTDAFIFIQL